MERKTVKIKSIEHINYNVLKIETEKPPHYDFKSGQATDVAMYKEGWNDEKRPFTFTNLPMEDCLEFIIKVYPSHDGVTEQLNKLKVDDELTIGDVYGAIAYKGKGVFLAGGAGITPFISIFRALELENKMVGNSLIFGNKTEKDIFFKDELESLLGRNYVNILSEEKIKEYPYGRIDKKILQDTVSDFSQHFYVCGPPKMTESVVSHLQELGVSKQKIITEDFN
ncbi:Flavodoxin reductase [Croceitalea dokdonensis DOKDO 023]|uniref:Flavodoxin reductase n=1 Tax=Croceitalea dokdonensis DOKDO 023 TaxID=1300341 RepID=A0A0P7AZX3_9FLAO|nr:flavodoxin reductase [Croceitalea dokdonensis]KPM32167.1 Flavodoxin reductase [Croceitalea dokdonensis DOKDO 023]